MYSDFCLLDPVCLARWSRLSGSAPQRMASITQFLGLHGLALAAVGDGINVQIITNCINRHEKITAVRGYSPITIELTDLPVFYFIYLTGGDAKILS